jgi:carbamoyl-phosphate synthase large subunit
MDEVLAATAELGYPVVVRPSFTMGGSGSGIAHDEAALHRIAGGGLIASPTTEVLLEESILGWKEYELELMRDRNDNVVVICSDRERRPDGRAHRRLGHRRAGAHLDRPRVPGDARPGHRHHPRGGRRHRRLQHPVRRRPGDGRMIVIEMNPRVSRSSALASKATGFPIAKIAAKVAVGYTLDEIPNDITRETPASFEPTLDYVVVKVPRFAFEKFPPPTPR